MNTETLVKVQEEIQEVTFGYVRDFDEYDYGHLYVDCDPAKDRIWPPCNDVY